MTWQANWPGVIATLIIAIPAIIAAWGAYRTGKQLKTVNGSSDQTLGEAVSDVREKLVTGNDKTAGTMITEMHGEASTQATQYETHNPNPDTAG